MPIEDSVAVLDSNTGMARPVRRGDAVGAEIPVTVHASRSAQSLGQNLPAVHEETRTVIVLPQGAVVRLTASLTPGESVVLTNRMTGADVLCRVSNVKSQPGIQHYVDLEFMQRAPGFWGDNLPALPEQGNAFLKTPTAPAPIVPPAVVAVPPAQPAPEPPPVALAPKAAPIAAQHPVAETLKPAPLAEAFTAPRPVRPPAAVTPIRPPAPRRVTTDAAPGGDIPQFLAESFDVESARGASFGSNSSNGSKRNLLVAAASIVLLVGASLGGFWFYSQGQGSALSSAPAPQQAANFPQSQEAPLVLPQFNPAVDEPPAAALNSASLPPAGTDIVIESRPVAERPANRAQPPVTPARAPLPAVRRNNLEIGKLQAPAPRTRPSTPAYAEAPPVIVGAAVDLGMAATDSTLLAGTGIDAASQPAKPRPSVGGQLQPPKLISSSAPVYPASARAQRLQGVVSLDVLVDETGKVVETTVIAGPLPLQEAAKAAVRTWKYQPAQLNGEAIPVHTKVALRFNLN